MALLSLAIGSFGIGMTEFVMMGLLPDVAQDLLPSLWATSQEVAIGKAGILISMYALGVVVGAPTIAVFVAKYPRKPVMIGLAIALAVFNSLAVFAPTFELVAAARFMAGLPHGAYFGIGGLVAAGVLGPGKRAQGVAFILTGLTVANIVGVPLGTWLGQQFGWRVTFLVVSLVFALGALLIALFVPNSPGDASSTIRSELSAFRRGQLWLTLALGAIGFGGFFAVYSYIAPLVTDVAGAPRSAVPLTLVLIGVGMTAGNLVGGWLADRNLELTLKGGLLAMAGVLVVMALTAQSIVMVSICAVLFGAVGSALIPSVQTRLMDVAGDSQTIAAALNHSALNVGNALGAALGGLTISLGFGYTSPEWVAAIMSIAGMLIVVLSFRLERGKAARVAKAEASAVR